jgi:hypothetical protein
MTYKILVRYDDKLDKIEMSEEQMNDRFTEGQMRSLENGYEVRVNYGIYARLLKS